MNRRIYGPYYRPEGDGGGGGGGDDKNKGLPDKEKDPDGYYREFYKREAQQAFDARDKAKEEARKLKEASMTPEQRKEYDDLKAQQAKAEEDRKRREGEFDAWKGDISKQHQEELKARDALVETEKKTREALEQDVANDKIFAAFAGASDLFGGDKAKTILSAQTAFRSMKEFCAFEVVEGSNGKRKMIVVRKPDGSRILGDDGNPAPFGEAIAKLIAVLPDKDHILRGSQKAGSGASGGSDYQPGELDLDHLTDEQLRDPKVRQALHDRSANAGGVQMGRAFVQGGGRTAAK